MVKDTLATMARTYHCNSYRCPEHLAENELDCCIDAFRWGSSTSQLRVPSMRKGQDDMTKPRKDPNAVSFFGVGLLASFPAVSV
jgi:hypothetical protein